MILPNLLVENPVVILNREGQEITFREKDLYFIEFQSGSLTAYERVFVK